MNLSTGALLFSFTQTVAQKDPLVIAVGGYPSFDQVYTISTYSTGYITRVFDITTNAFVKYYSSTDKNFTASAVTYGMQYHSSQDNSFYSILSKIPYTDTIINSVLFTVVPSDISEVILTIIAAAPELTNVSASRSVTISSLTTSAPAALIQIRDTKGDLNYNNGTLVKIYTPHAYEKVVDMNIPCTTNGGIPMTAAITTYLNGTASPGWVSIKPDGSETIIAIAPTITTDEESFYVGINFGYATFTYSQYNELVVFQCKISGCED
jgi:hypothetical protein